MLQTANKCSTNHNEQTCMHLTAGHKGLTVLVGTTRQAEYVNHVSIRLSALIAARQDPKKSGNFQICPSVTKNIRNDTGACCQKKTKAKALIQRVCCVLNK